MTTDTIFKKVQKIIADIPLILAGTGVSIPHGIPGMKKLAVFLQEQLHEKYMQDPSWVIMSSRLEDDVDLETALTDVNPSPSELLVRDITAKTWEFVSEYDLKCFHEMLATGNKIPLSRLLRILTQSSKNNVNIITTNYDRLIEYACDQAHLNTDDRFCGKYDRWTTTSQIKTQNVVNILKVHGSLDYFKDSKGIVHALPMRDEIPDGFVPDIIPPGSDKYRSVLQGIHRDLLREADSLIKLASGFLCIGYGFNDEQIQATMLEEIKLGKPVIVVTQEISDSVASMLLNTSDNYIIIQEAKTKGYQTEFIVNGQYFNTEEDYWSIAGFMNIIS